MRQTRQVMLEHAAEARDINGNCRDNEDEREVNTYDDKSVVIDNLEVEELCLRQAGHLSQEPEDSIRLGQKVVQARRVAGCNTQNVRHRTS